MKTSTPLYSRLVKPYLETHWHAVKQIQRDLANKAVLQALWPQKFSPSLSLNYKKPANVLRERRWSLLSSFKSLCQTGKMIVFSGRTESPWRSHQEEVPTGGHPLWEGRALDCTIRQICIASVNQTQLSGRSPITRRLRLVTERISDVTVQRLTVFKQKSPDTTKDGSGYLD